MSAQTRIVEAAHAAGLAVEQGPALRAFTSISIRGDFGRRLVLDADSLGRLTGGRRYLPAAERPSVLGPGLEARAMSWIMDQTVPAPASDGEASDRAAYQRAHDAAARVLTGNDDPFAGPEASAVAAGMVLEDGNSIERGSWGRTSTEGSVTMVASGNAVVGRVNRDIRRGGTVQLRAVASGFELDVWSDAHTCTTVAFSRSEAAGLARAMESHGITA